MGNSTFSGPVRSENGFQVVSKNATTGAITTVANTASTGIVTNKYVKHVGFATGVTVNTTAGDSPTIGEFTQPANTIITNIKINTILCFKLFVYLEYKIIKQHTKTS